MKSKTLIQQIKSHRRKMIISYQWYIWACLFFLCISVGCLIAVAITRPSVLNIIILSLCVLLDGYNLGTVVQRYREQKTTLDKMDAQFKERVAQEIYENFTIENKNRGETNDDN